MTSGSSRRPPGQRVVRRRLDDVRHGAGGDHWRYAGRTGGTAGRFDGREPGPGKHLDPTIKGRNISVELTAGVVTLRGQVASEDERAQALMLARSTPGVQRVEDYLTVDAALQ